MPTPIGAEVLIDILAKNNSIDDRSVQKHYTADFSKSSNISSSEMFDVSVYILYFLVNQIENIFDKIQNSWKNSVDNTLLSNKSAFLIHV
jgi:hypothetical protein